MLHSFPTRRSSDLIEEYINWKVIEEQKVSAIVTGSKITQKHLKNIMKLCHTPVTIDGKLYNGAVSRNPAKNKELARAIKEARREQVPLNYVERVIQLAAQGFVRSEEHTSELQSR